MRNLKIILLGMLVAVACVQAGGSASVVAKKSKAKGFTYSFETRERFVGECKIQQQYSEVDYWRLENDLRKNIDHPNYIAYLTKSVEECDQEAARKSSGSHGGLFGGGGGGISTRSR